MSLLCHGLFPCTGGFSPSLYQFVPVQPRQSIPSVMACIPVLCARPPRAAYRTATRFAGIHSILSVVECPVCHAIPVFSFCTYGNLIDECSQLDNEVASKLIYALEELPHQPFVGVAADYHQLQPVGTSGTMKQWCDKLDIITLNYPSDRRHAAFELSADMPHLSAIAT